VTVHWEEIMANPAPAGASDHDAKIIMELPASRGRVGGPWASIRVLTSTPVAG
jgi:hypothetical protein